MARGFTQLYGIDYFEMFFSDGKDGYCPSFLGTCDALPVAHSTVRCQERLSAWRPRGGSVHATSSEILCRTSWHSLPIVEVTLWTEIVTVDVVRPFLVRHARTYSRSVGFEPTTLGFGDPRSTELN